MTQWEVALEACVTQSHVSKVLDGTRTPGEALPRWAGYRRRLVYEWIPRR